ncbi:MAG: hypothetical protein ABID64_00505 [Nitrospirota bacterium]
MPGLELSKHNETVTKATKKTVLVTKTKKLRAKATGAPAAELAKPETSKHLPGKIHGKYYEMVKKIDPTAKESYRSTMASMEASKIRENSRILKTSNKKETGKQRILNLREEQARRIAAYTSKCGPNSYILKYSPNQENTIGCGEIFLTANLIKIEKDGSTIIAKRMVTPSGKHQGRLAFCDVNPPHDYIATHSSDKVTILDNQERVNINDPKAVATHIKILDQEETTRKAHAKKYKQDETVPTLPTSVSPTAKETVSSSEYGQLDKNKSILSQIRDKLSPIQLKHVEIIIRLGKAVKTRDFPNGLPPNLIAAMIMNAKMESDLRNIQSSCKNKNGTRERSFGLFQKNYDASKLKGETVEDFKKRFMDPVYNTQYVINKNILGYTGKKLRAAAKAGASVQQLTSLFCIHIERPAKKYLRGRQRAFASTKFFYLKSRPRENSIKEWSRTPDRIGRNAGHPNVRTRLSNGQDKWIFSSSQGTLMEIGRGLLKNPKTGICAIGAYNSKNFFSYFMKNVWPRVKDFKLPKKIIIAGLYLNGAGSWSPQKSLEYHMRIVNFFKSKGVEVKIATSQPYAKHNKRINDFNDLLRTKGLTEDRIDLAKKVAPNGTCEKGTLADGLHLSYKTRKHFAKDLEQA